MKNLREFFTLFYCNIRDRNGSVNSDCKAGSWGSILSSRVTFHLCCHLQTGSGGHPVFLFSKHFARSVKLSLTSVQCLD